MCEVVAVVVIVTVTEAGVYGYVVHVRSIFRFPIHITSGAVGEQSNQTRVREVESYASMLFECEHRGKWLMLIMEPCKN
jgi:hypothetical protein